MCRAPSRRSFPDSQCSHRLDWHELALLLSYYRLELLASIYLRTLQDDCRLEIPAEGQPLLSLHSFDARALKEFKLLSRKPAIRGPFEMRALKRIALDAHRSHAYTSVPGLGEAILSKFCAHPAKLALMWRLAQCRVPGGAVAAPRFLEGFSYPERDGRWTEGRWALLAIPLNGAQRRGEPVPLRMHAFFGKRKSTRIVVYAGHERRLWKPRKDHVSELALQCRPVDRLEGDGLILFWMPKATSPEQEGLSGDQRQLGVFVHRLDSSINPSSH